MDALSDLLRVVRFSGGLFLESNWRAPWCVRSQVDAEVCGPGIRADGGLVGFHYVLDKCRGERNSSKTGNSTILRTEPDFSVPFETVCTNMV
jgi:Cupin